MIFRNYDLTVPHNLKIQPYPYQLKGIAVVCNLNDL